VEIELYNDVAFKWIFGRQERTKPLLSLLNAVTGYEGSESVFGDIKIMNPFDMSKFSEDKSGILDIRVMDKKSGVWADVEVQVRYQAVYPERAMYYLAGIYRDQLRSGEEFEELRQCYGVHLLVADLFENEPEWYNHFRMLNVKNHHPLSFHWELYFIELEKFRRKLKGGNVKRNSLEQWSDFLSKPQDPSAPMDKHFHNNPGIEEVYAMLQEFTKDDQLREQYRLHEEWLREQRYYERLMKKQQEEMEKQQAEMKEYQAELLKTKRLKEKAEQQKIEAEQQKIEAEQQKIEAEQQKKKAEQRKIEAEQQKIEAEQQKIEAEQRNKLLEKELKKNQMRSVLAFKKSGFSDKKISELLGISEDDVKAIS